MPRRKKIEFQIRKVTNPLWGNFFRKKDSEVSENISLLSKVRLFEGLSKKDLFYINNILYERFYESDEYIFKESNPASTMFILKKGLISIEKVIDNKIEVHATLESGDFFGETSMIDDSERNLSSRSVSKSTILILFRNDLFDLFEKEPKLGVKVLKNLSYILNERLKKNNEELLIQIRKNDELTNKLNEYELNESKKENDEKK